VKAECRDESSCAKRGTKRRGKRSGHRNARKSRRLVTADPGSIEPSTTKSTRNGRRNYLEDRFKKYQFKLVRFIARADYLIEKFDLSGRFDDDRILKLRAARKRKVLLMLSILQRKNDKQFAKNILKVLVQVERMGWDSLPVDHDETNDSHERMTGLPRLETRQTAAPAILSVTHNRVETREFIDGAMRIVNRPRPSRRRGKAPLSEARAPGVFLGGRQPLTGVPARKEKGVRSGDTMKASACVRCGLVGSRRGDTCAKCRLEMAT